MLDWIKELDNVLRGEATRPERLIDGKIELPIGKMTVVVLLLATFYGTCMGCYSVFRVTEDAAYPPTIMQMVASAVKTPALFVLTLAVTFPSLYVFNALVGSRLSLVPVLKLLIASLAVNLAVLASLGPIVAFFSVSTTSYPFMTLLNVLAFAVAGVLGLIFLMQTLNRLTFSQQARRVASAAQTEPAEASEPAAGVSETDEGLRSDDPPSTTALADMEGPPPHDPGPLDPIGGHVLSKHVKTVFSCWVFVFGLVGAQMGWVLRPFIGSPSLPFQWFRERQSNFFQAVFQALADLFT